MAVRLTRAERKAQTREEILEAARRVFTRRGFHGASLDEIAEEAGFTKGAVYSSFEGKDDLFLALLEGQIERRLATYIEAARRAETFEAALRAIARLMAGIARHEPSWIPLVVEFWTHASREPALRAEAFARHNQVLDANAEVLADLAVRFGAEWTLRPREIVRGAAALARGIALERLLDPDGVDPAIFEQQFVGFVTAHLREKGAEGGSAS